MKGDWNGKGTPGSVGLSLLNDVVKYEGLVDTSGGYGYADSFTWQATPWLIIGATSKVKAITDPLNNIKWNASCAGHF